MINSADIFHITYITLSKISLAIFIEVNFQHRNKLKNKVLLFSYIT